MDPHVHISPVHILASALFIVAALGTLHLLAIGKPENRISRAYLSLGL